MPPGSWARTRAPGPGRYDGVTMGGGAGAEERGRPATQRHSPPAQASAGVMRPSLRGPGMTGSLGISHVRHPGSPAKMSVVKVRWFAVKTLVHTILHSSE